MKHNRCVNGTNICLERVSAVFVKNEIISQIHKKVCHVISLNRKYISFTDSVAKEIIFRLFPEILKRTCQVNPAGENSSLLQYVSHMFQFIILGLPMYFYIWLSKNFSKPTSKSGEIGHFNRSLLIESFWLTLKSHSFIASNIKSTCRIFMQPNIYCLI